MKRGFIQIPILIAIIIAVTVIGGGGYVAYEVGQKSTSGTNESITEETADEGVATTSTTNTKEEKDGADSIKIENNSVISSFKNQIDELIQKTSILKAETPKTMIIILPSGAVVETDASGNITRTIKEAPLQVYISPVAITQDSPQNISQPQTEDVNQTPPIQIDVSTPKIWEAQFGEQIRTHIPELSTWAPKMIRLVINEPIDADKTKFRFRSPMGTRELNIALNIVTENILRGHSDTCYVNCDKGGYYSTFFLSESLSAKVPQGASIPGNYDFEFLVVDMAGNYSIQWHSARDISEFVYQ